MKPIPFLASLLKGEEVWGAARAGHGVHGACDVFMVNVAAFLAFEVLLDRDGLELFLEGHFQCFSQFHVSQRLQKGHKAWPQALLHVLGLSIRREQQTVTAEGSIVGGFDEGYFCYVCRMWI